jgi:U3 small nucleolar RNA-associated protein 7
VTASKVEQWLLPSEGGYLETDGLEDTCHFSLESIVKEVDVMSARAGFELHLPGQLL